MLEEGGVHMSGGNGGGFQLRVEDPFSAALNISDSSTSLTFQPSSSLTARYSQAGEEKLPPWLHFR